MSNKNKEPITLDLIKLDDMGVRYVIATYTGGGDSGQIDDYYVYYHEHISRDEDEIDIVYDKFSNWRNDKITCTSEIPESIKDYFYELLDCVEDWYNNDGGHGTVILNVTTGKSKVFNHIHITTTESYEHNFQLNKD